MSEPVPQRILAAGLLIAALVLLAIGERLAYPVYPDPALTATPPSLPEPDWDAPAPLVSAPMEWPPTPVEPRRMSDRLLVENATFTGVTRKEDRFYLTYNPAQARGKRSCPT